MGGRFPWNKNTSEDIAEQTDPRFETPQGAQIKANTARDEAIAAAGVYTDTQTGAVVSLAAEAQATAATALTNANSAQGVAGQANSKATTAQSTADTALSNAATAQQTANGAQTAANTAQARADAAYELAEQSGGVVNSFGSIGGVAADSPGDTLTFSAGSGMQVVSDPETNTITFATTGGGSGGDVPDGTLTQKGIVQLSSTAGTDETRAATPKLVKDAYDAGTRAASTTQSGQSQLNDAINSTSTTQAGTANAVRKAYDRGSNALTVAQTPASTTAPGRVQLNDTNTSNATDQAATANASRVAYETASRLGSTTQVGQVQMYDGIDSTSTTLVATANAVRLAAQSGGGGSVQIGTTEAVTYYVDGSAGSDTTGTGTQTLPFKTIQFAADKLWLLCKGKLNHPCNIRAQASQTYAEDVLVAGFWGAGSLYITGNYSGTTKANLRSLRVVGCSCQLVLVQNVNFNADSEFGAIQFTAVLAGFFSNSIVNTGSLSAYAGVAVSNSKVVVRNNTISYRNQAISCASSEVTSDGNSGTNNTVGLSAIQSGTIGKVGTQPTAGTAESQSSGGVIRA